MPTIYNSSLKKKKKKLFKKGRYIDYKVLIMKINLEKRMT